MQLATSRKTQTRHVLMLGTSWLWPPEASISDSWTTSSAHGRKRDIFYDWFVRYSKVVLRVQTFASQIDCQEVFLFSIPARFRATFWSEWCRSGGIIFAGVSRSNGTTFEVEKTTPRKTTNSSKAGSNGSSTLCCHRPLSQIIGGHTERRQVMEATNQIHGKQPHQSLLKLI